jgi:hypothetical protein
VQVDTETLTCVCLARKRLVYAGLRTTMNSGELSKFFVVAGSACHFWAVLRYVAPLA